MRKTIHILGIIFTLFLLSMATEKSLMAYADPGSGAMFSSDYSGWFYLTAPSSGIRTFVKRFRRRKDEKDQRTEFVMGSDNYVRPSK